MATLNAIRNNCRKVRHPAATRASRRVAPSPPTPRPRRPRGRSH